MEKENTNKDDDAFIRYNHENKALKLVYKELKIAINEKLLMARRKFFRYKYINKALLLGRKHCALLLMFMEGEGLPDYDVDINNFNYIDTDISELKLWGMSIYVSMEDDYKIEIIGNLGSLDGENDLYLREDLNKNALQTLVNIDELVNNLPDSMKIKKV
jgi:hypothetical protein